MNLIYLPKNPSIDIATTAWYASILNGVPETDIRTVPATWTGKEMSSSDMCIGLNVEEKEIDGLSIKYGLNKNDRMDSCFTTYLKHLEINIETSPFNSLSTYLSLTLTGRGPWPNTKNSSFNPHLVDISYIFEALKGRITNIGKDSDTDVDSELLNIWFEIMDSYLYKQRSSIRAQEIANGIQIELVGDVSIACVESEGDISAQSISKSLFNKDVDVIVYKEGTHVGVIRSRKVQSPDLSLLSSKIDEDDWYFYPKGTMAARGTRSRLVDTPSKYTKEDLMSLVAELINDSVAV